MRLFLYVLYQAAQFTRAYVIMAVVYPCIWIIEALEWLIPRLLRVVVSCYRFIRGK